MKAIAWFFISLFVSAFPADARAVDFPDGYVAYKGIEHFDRALAEAKRNGKKVMLVLSITFCPPCNYVIGSLSRDDLRAVYQANFIGVYAEWDQMSALEREKMWLPYGHRIAPSFVFFDPSGAVICKSIGGFNIPEEGIRLGKKVLAATNRTDSSGAKEAPHCRNL